MEQTASRDQLHTLQHEISGMELTLRETKRQFSQLQTAIVNTVLDEQGSVCNCCDSGCHTRRLVISHWDCAKSPIDVCVYEVNKDPWHDACVFCHQPEERM